MTFSLPVKVVLAVLGLAVLWLLGRELRKIPAKLHVLMFTAFLDMVGTLMVIPLLPFYATRLGGGGLMVGVLVSAFSVAQLLSAPMWGRFSDKFGRRPTLMVAMAASAMAYVIFGFADSLFLLFLSRIVQGAGGGTVGVIQAYVADATPPKDRARSLGWLSAATNLGVALGPVLGSLAVAWGKLPIGFGTNTVTVGHAAPGLLAAFLCVLNLIFAWIYLRESRETHEATTTKPKTSREAVTRVITHPREPAARLIWIYAIAMGAFMGVTGMLALYLAKRFGVTEETIGYLFMYIGVISVLTRLLLLGRLVDTLGEAKLQETAAQSSNELLASVPQVSNYFNRVPVSDLAIAVNQIQISRPNLRNISGSNASSSATLILVDGHRIATAGTSQASIDPDLIPTGAVARVEVMTEGGSATYGADADAGVINFITHRRFDGLKVDAHYGFADDYWQWDASATLGHTWDNGSAWVSYSYTKNDSLFGRDRDYIRNLNYTTQPYVGRDLGCAKPNLAINTILTAFNFTLSSVSYATPGLVANTSNLCDNSENATIVPEAQRHGVMAGVDWDFGDSTSINLRGYWGQRETVAHSVNTGSVAINANNPTVASSLPAGVALGVQPFTIFGSPVLVQAAVNFSFEPLPAYAQATSSTLIREWGANAELKHTFDGNWQLRGLLNWSESDSAFHLTGVNGGRLNTAGAPAAPATAAASFNPFNLASNSPTLLADLFDNETTAQARDHLINARLIADGKLFELPGGAVRVAIGYEFMHDKLEKRIGTGIRLGTLQSVAYTPYSRDVHSVFGELVVPVLSDGNGGALLTVSAQGRYDHYSDFGSTFNPKFGATLKAADWLSFRANWGTSFTAPTPLDQLGALSSTISSFNFVPFQKPGTVLLGGSNNTIAYQGSTPGLKPQTADTWSVGFDAEPVAGLKLSASYYDVNFTNILGTPTSNVAIFDDFPGNVLYDVNGLTATQVTNFLTANGTVPLTPGLQTQLTNTLTSIAGGRVVELVDFRVGNFGILHVKGVDLALNFNHPTGFGSVDFSWNMNAQLSRKAQVSPTSAISDRLALGETPKVTSQMVLGTDIGQFRAQATWNHTSGYDITPTASSPSQSRVDAFNVVNLFFKYDFAAETGVLGDLSFTLNVNNVFDQDPPILLRNNPNENGFANGFTLGRMIIFGVSKKF